VEDLVTSELRRAMEEEKPSPDTSLPPTASDGKVLATHASMTTANKARVVCTSNQRLHHRIAIVVNHV
jgi:hypothetical protein